MTIIARSSKKCRSCFQSLGSVHPRVQSKEYVLKDLKYPTLCRARKRNQFLRQPTKNLSALFLVLAPVLTLATVSVLLHLMTETCDFGNLALFYKTLSTAASLELPNCISASG